MLTSGLPWVEAGQSVTDSGHGTITLRTVPIPTASHWRSVTSPPSQMVGASEVWALRSRIGTCVRMAVVSCVKVGTRVHSVFELCAECV